jgi:hypothetical protein
VPLLAKRSTIKGAKRRENRTASCRHSRQATTDDISIAHCWLRAPRHAPAGPDSENDLLLSGPGQHHRHYVVAAVITRRKSPARFRLATPPFSKQLSSLRLLARFKNSCHSGSSRLRNIIIRAGRRGRTRFQTMVATYSTFLRGVILPCDRDFLWCISRSEAEGSNPHEPKKRYKQAYKRT